MSAKPLSMRRPISRNPTFDRARRELEESDNAKFAGPEFWSAWGEVMGALNPPEHLTRETWKTALDGAFETLRAKGERHGATESTIGDLREFINLVGGLFEPGLFGERGNAHTLN